MACTGSLIDELDDEIICFYGDHPFFKKETIKRIAESHNGPITMITTEVNDFNDWRKNLYYWGRIIRDQDGQVKENIEFRDASDEVKKIKEVNPSMYCFGCQWLWPNLKKIKNHNAQEEYYLTDVIKLAFQQNLKINTFSIDPQESVGINSREELALAETLV